MSQSPFETLKMQTQSLVSPNQGQHTTGATRDLMTPTAPSHLSFKLSLIMFNNFCWSCFQLVTEIKNNYNIVILALALKHDCQKQEVKATGNFLNNPEKMDRSRQSERDTVNPTPDTIHQEFTSRERLSKTNSRVTILAGASDLSIYMLTHFFTCSILKARVTASYHACLVCLGPWD